VTVPIDAFRPDDEISPRPPLATVGAPADPVGRNGRTGAITLTRHGEPGLSRKVKLNAAQYVDWWARYEETGLLAGQTPPAGLVELVRKADVVMSSTRIRAIETARAVTGGRAFDMDPSLIEAPLPPPPWPDWLRLPPRHWGLIARIWWWFFNHHEPGQESCAEAKRRADDVAARLDAMARAGDDVVVLAHGFFNTMIGFSLKRLGWKLVDDQGWRYWCARRFERR
jgi:broad specificity phosphatase PhoE